MKGEIYNIMRLAQMNPTNITNRIEKFQEGLKFRARQRFIMKKKELKEKNSS